jgi:hypothetical protein
MRKGTECLIYYDFFQNTVNLSDLRSALRTLKISKKIPKLNYILTIKFSKVNEILKGSSDQKIMKELKYKRIFFIER